MDKDKKLKETIKRISEMPIINMVDCGICNKRIRFKESGKLLLKNPKVRHKYTLCISCWTKMERELKRQVLIQGRTNGKNIPIVKRKTW